MCFKESRSLSFFFITVMFYVTIEGPNITIKKWSSIFDTYILIENLLFIVPHDVCGIALLSFCLKNNSWFYCVRGLWFLVWLHLLGPWSQSKCLYYYKTTHTPFLCHNIWKRFDDVYYKKSFYNKIIALWTMMFHFDIMLTFNDYVLRGTFPYYQAI